MMAAAERMDGLLDEALPELIDRSFLETRCGLAREVLDGVGELRMPWVDAGTPEKGSHLLSRVQQPCMNPGHDF